MRIGIDMGGTKIAGLALDDAGRELARLRVPTPSSYDAVLGALQEVVWASNLRSMRRAQPVWAFARLGTFSPAAGSSAIRICSPSTIGPSTET